MSNSINGKRSCCEDFGRVAKRHLKCQRAEIVADLLQVSLDSIQVYQSMLHESMRAEMKAYLVSLIPPDAPEGDLAFLRQFFNI